MSRSSAGQSRDGRKEGGWEEESEREAALGSQRTEREQAYTCVTAMRSAPCSLVVDATSPPLARF